MAADYPNEKMKQTTVPSAAGHVGALKDSNIEGRASEKETIRKNSSASNKKSAGHVGATNLNYSTA